MKSLRPFLGLIQNHEHQKPSLNRSFSSKSAAGIVFQRSAIRADTKPNIPIFKKDEPKKPKTEIIDEEEEDTYPPKVEEKKPKKMSISPKKSSSAKKAPQVLYPDNIELDISPQIKKAVSKKGKAQNPQVESDLDDEDALSAVIGAPHENFNEHITKVHIIFPFRAMLPLYFDSKSLLPAQKKNKKKRPVSR